MDENNRDVIGVRQEAEKKKILDRLRKTPIIQIAVERAEVGRATFYRWTHEDLEFAKAVDEAIADGVTLINDMSESTLVSLIRDRKMPAISFWLKHRHATYKQKSPNESEQKKVISLNIIKYGTKKD
jgi:hypothetical protein